MKSLVGVIGGERLLSCHSLELERLCLVPTLSGMQQDKVLLLKAFCFLTEFFLCSYLVAPVYDRSDVCTKYQEASKIVNLALQGLVSQCLPGAKVIDLCEFGHTVITTQASKLYTKKVNGRAIDRGVAFPVCISVNDIVCNHSPLPTEERVSKPCAFCFLSRCLSWSTQVHHDRMPLSVVSTRTVLPFRKGVH